MYAAPRKARRRTERREALPAPPALAVALGNRAFARFVAARRALAREPVEAPAAPALDVDALAIDLMTGGTKKRRISSDVALQTWWPDLKKDLLAKPDSKGALPASKFTPLRTPERSEAFAAMTDEQRLETMWAILDSLTQMLTAGAVTGELIKAETEAVGKRATENTLGQEGGWALVRSRVYATFGTLDAAHDYYENWVTDGRFFGRLVVVHKDLEAALKRAETKYVELGGDPAGPEMASVGGMTIRSNTNRPAELSDHSFGWAIDIDGATQVAGKGVAAGNPNVREKNLAAQGIPDFWEFVKEITGEDVFKRDAKGKRVSDSDPGDADERVAEADRLQQLSDRLMAMFADETALALAMGAYVRSRGVSVPPAGEASLAALAVAAARLGPPSSKKDPKKAERDGYLTQLGDLVQAWFSAPAANGEVTEGPIQSAAIATRLFQMGLMFMASGNAAGSTEVPNAEAAGTLGSIAAHGFLNLDPLLVGALNSTDGGGLRWLGTTGGTKDFMHFELVKPPEIVPAQPVAD